MKKKRKKNKEKDCNDFYKCIYTKPIILGIKNIVLWTRNDQTKFVISCNLTFNVYSSAQQIHRCTLNLTTAKTYRFAEQCRAP